MRDRARRRAETAWRTPPTRIGRIDQDPLWIELLVRFAPLISIGIAAATALLVAYIWAADLTAGHL